MPQQSIPLSEFKGLRLNYLRNRPIAIDLFAGVGGLSLGLELAGFAIASHVELDETAARYAEYNFPLTHTLGGDDRGDIRNISASELLKDLSTTDTVALIAGGPPCQGFSLAGKKDRDDPLNGLVLNMAKIILEVQPLAFVIENVPGITSASVWQLGEALSQLSKVYRVSEAESLYAPDFGVPQTRRRVFVLGFRRDLGIAPSHPEPTHHVPGKPRTLFSPTLMTPTVIQSLDDLPEVDEYPHLVNGDEVSYTKAAGNEFQRSMRDCDAMASARGYKLTWDSSTCTNCRRTQHGDDLLERLSRLDFGEMDGPSGIRRLEPNGLSTTIRAGTTSERGSWSAPRPCHYSQARVLTTRECARIQTFPDWFRFHPVKWHGNRQVGNAVPVLLAEAVGKHILKLLRLNANTHSSIPLIQRNDALIAGDIARAESARLDERKMSHQVVGTRKPGNQSRGPRKPLEV